MRKINILFVIIFALFGCTVGADGSEFQLSAGEPVMTTGGDSGDTTSTDTGEPEPDLPEMKLDLNTEDGEDTVFECRDLDILFVIDNSGSMTDNQDKLAAEIPGFVAKLQMLGLGDNSLHIGVVSTDDFKGNPDECQEIGALITQKKGDYPDYEPIPCGPYVDGFTFMTEADDLATSFVCAVSLGTGGSGSERQIEAAISALKPTPAESMSPFEARPDYCNEDFHRRAIPGNGDGDGYPGAGLVVVWITDEDDNSSSGDPIDWIDQLKWLRRPIGSMATGNLSNTSFLALLETEECGAWDPPDRIKEFLSMTPVSYVGDICDDDYGQFFNIAIGIVEQGCGVEYEPVP